MGDIGSLVENIQQHVDLDKQPEMLARLQEGKFSLRDMREQFQTILNMGPISKVCLLVCCVAMSGHGGLRSICDLAPPTRNQEGDMCADAYGCNCVRRRVRQVMSMLPGFMEDMIPKGKEAEGTAQIKRFMCIMDSMNSKGMLCEICERQIRETNM